MVDDIVIIGAGPSGLAAASEATRLGARTTVVERLERVGGLARTIEFENCRFDVGPHRFFTRNEEVNKLFSDVVGEDLIRVRRKTRIMHGRVFFDYPLTPLNAVLGMGFGAGCAVGLSYAHARINAVLAPRRIENFEDWAIDRFGRHLYETFFKAYTEKIWGVSCREIGADWASQRIRGLSLRTALSNALFPSKIKIKTLVDEFSYPRLGAGQTYEKMAAIMAQQGGDLLTGTRVFGLRREGMCIRAALTTDTPAKAREIEGKYFLVSAPLTDMVEMMRPLPPPDVLAACRALRYREHIAVNLVIKGHPFPDQWIYVHDERVAMARITNYRNFSAAMAGSDDVSPITIEYFAFPGDALSQSSDDRLIERAIAELTKVQRFGQPLVKNGFVVRSPKAYPVTEIGYRPHFEKIKTWLDGFDNLLPIGRAGMFKYNNQDHAMATGLLAARTALGLQRLDPWLVNIDAEYHESANAR